MSTSQQIDEPVDSVAGGQPPADRSGLWPGFWPWITTTVLLAILVAVFWWQLETREPQVVEVPGPVPPPAEPAPELIERAAQLNLLIARRQQELSDRIAALDPPRCRPPEQIDLALLAEARKAEAPNIARWRSLLVPGAAPLGVAEPEAAAEPEPSQGSAPLLRRTAPGAEPTLPETEAD